MKARFYVKRFIYYPERPYYEPHFTCDTTYRFGNLVDALKFAFKDHEARNGFTGESNKTGEIIRYGGCEIRRGIRRGGSISTEIAHIYFDGKIEYRNEKVRRIAERLGR